MKKTQWVSIGCVMVALCAWGIMGGYRPKADAVSDMGPELGTLCKVQFRRDALGAGANYPLSPTIDSFNGADVTVVGKLKSFGENWIILDAVTEPSSAATRKYWINRESILMIVVEEKLEQ